MSDSLSAQAHKETIASVKRDTPMSFTVGGHADILARKGEGVVSFDRSWKTGWGATAYLKGWWNDTAVVPQERKGVTIGGEGTFKF